MDKKWGSNFGSKQKVNPFKRVHEYNDLGLKILTLGIPAHDFLGKLGLKRVILYALVHLTTTVSGFYELAYSLFWSESFMELLNHWYVTMYSWCVGFQFIYMCGILKEISDENFGNEHFYTTKMVPERAEEILKRNLDGFARFFVVFLVILAGTYILYVGGSIIDVIVELATTGTVQQIFVLSYYSNVPLWGQAVVSIINIFTGLICCSVSTSIFIVTGIRSLKIKTQCEILKEALSLANVDMRRCIEDHVELMRIAKRSTEIFRILNNPLFFTMYFCLAIQLLTLSLIEPTGSYFFSMGADVMSVLVILHSQCWFSSSITLSLESIAVSSYFSHWCDKNESFAKDVIIMMNMAQRPTEQKLWLNSLTLERATTLRIIRSSYSFYTMLMIFQERK